MGQNDSSGQLHQVLEPSVADRAHAVWVLLGSAAVEYVSPLPARLRRDVQDVLWMLDVAAPEVLRHRRKRGEASCRTQASLTSQPSSCSPA